MATGSTTTLDRVSAHALVPRGLGTDVVGRIRAALGAPLVDAVPRELAALESVDAGGYWVLREVRASVAVPASEPDPHRTATLVARAMAAAVVDAVRAGPSPDAVRFPGREGYAAAFVRALLRGGARSWVFARLAPLADLPPADAVPAVAGTVDVDALAVVRALAVDGTWRDLLAATPPSAALRLATVLGRRAAAPADAPASALVREVRRTRRPAVGGWQATAAGRRLELLGEVAAVSVPTPGLVAAVWSLEPDPADPPTGPARGTLPAVASPGAVQRSEDGPGQSSGVPPEGDGPHVLVGPGATAFQLVADLDDVLDRDGPAAALAGRGAVAGEARAAVLAAVLGRGVDARDPLVRLAAGAALPAEPGDLRAAVAALAPWPAALVADEMFGAVHPGDAEWLAPLAADEPGLVPLARAVLRRFAAHLPGFGAAGPAYIAERVLPLGGAARLERDAIVVELPRGSLGVLLSLAGVDAFGCRPRWLDLPVLVAHEGS